MSESFSYFSSRNFQSDEFKTVCFQDGSPGLSLVKPMFPRTAIGGQGRGGSGAPSQYQALIVPETDVDRLAEVVHVFTAQLCPQDIVIEQRCVEVILEGRQKKG